MEWYLGNISRLAAFYRSLQVWVEMSRIHALDFTACSITLMLTYLDVYSYLREFTACPPYYNPVQVIVQHWGRVLHAAPAYSVT